MHAHFVAVACFKCIARGCFKLRYGGGVVVVDADRVEAHGLDLLVHAIGLRDEFRLEVYSFSTDLCGLGQRQRMLERSGNRGRVDLYILGFRAVREGKTQGFDELSA